MNDLQKGISGETVLLVQALALKFVALQEFPGLGCGADISLRTPAAAVQSLLWLTLFDSKDCSPEAPLSIGFSRQEYWSRSSFPSPEDPSPLTVQTHIFCLAGSFFTTKPRLHKMFSGVYATVPHSRFYYHLWANILKYYHDFWLSNYIYLLNSPVSFTACLLFSQKGKKKNQPSLALHHL